MAADFYFKLRYTVTRTYDFTSQKMGIFVITAVQTSNLPLKCDCLKTGAIRQDLARAATINTCI